MIRPATPPWSRLFRLGVVAVVALTSVALGAASSTASDKTIRTMGNEDVHINSKIFSDLRFSPGNTTVKSGDDLTISHDDKTQEPYTLTIVNADERPTDTDSVFACGEPGTLCDEVFSTVQPQIVDETQPQFVNVSGGAGLDGRLDTVWLPAARSVFLSPHRRVRHWRISVRSTHGCKERSKSANRNRRARCWERALSEFTGCRYRTRCRRRPYRRPAE